MVDFCVRCINFRQNIARGGFVGGRVRRFMCVIGGRLKYIVALCRFFHSNWGVCMKRNLYEYIYIEERKLVNRTSDKIIDLLTV